MSLEDNQEAKEAKEANEANAAKLQALKAALKAASRRPQKTPGVLDGAWLQTYRTSGRKAYVAEGRACVDSLVGLTKKNPRLANDNEIMGLIPHDPDSAYKRQYNAHALKMGIRFLTFLGLPDQIHFQARSFSKRETFSAVLAVVMAIPTLAKNLVKLLTEFLPLAGYIAAEKKIAQYAHGDATASIERSHSKRIAMQILAGVCYGLHFIGRAITSPSRGLRKAYRTEYIIQNTTQESDARTQSVRVSRPAGIALAVLSGLITVTVYAALLPFVMVVAAPSLAVAGAAFIAKSAVFSALAKAFAWVGSSLATSLQAIGIASIPAAVVGLSSVTATVATTVCGVASEVDVRRKGSHGKINKALQEAVPVQENVGRKRKVRVKPERESLESKPEPSLRKLSKPVPVPVPKAPVTGSSGTMFNSHKPAPAVSLAIKPSSVAPNVG